MIWNVSRSQSGITSVTALISLLLMFSLLTILLIAFSNYNYSVQEQLRLEHERTQERIILSSAELDSQQEYISSVNIRNIGTIDVRIRAVYVRNDTATTLVCDPSIYMETKIGPNETLRALLPAGVPIEPTAKIAVATERGIKTSEFEGILIFGPPQPHWKYNPSRLYIGPLMLQFDAFWYRKTSANGNFNPNDPWLAGWSIPKGSGYIAWNITVMNIDNRNITINRFSSFTAVPNDSPSSELSWYLEPDPEQRMEMVQFLPVNETRYILYMWSAPKRLPDEGGSDQVQKMVLPETTCMVFLTFFGVFHELDGSTTPYAQTIPFEAAITIL